MTQEAWITVRVTGARGSVPRDAGTQMFVSAAAQSGTIGGGALEWEATKLARQMLEAGTEHIDKVVPLGPTLGQCCGGVVTLSLSREAPQTEPQRVPLIIWGAGHVGRAIAGVMAPLADRTVTLVDTQKTRFPETLPVGVDPLVAADMPRAVAFMPNHADHMIVTYSHQIDLALCDALLRTDARFVGLIGSATKWARFRKKLGAMGHSDRQVARITCPIGDRSLGKHPQAIAIGVAQGLLSQATHGTKDEAPMTGRPIQGHRA